MKKKTYNVLKWIPIVNIFLPRPAISIYGSLAIEDGLADKFAEALNEHPELKDELITEKIVAKLLSEKK